MLIERPPRFFRRLVPKGIFRLNTPNRCVALTFDDGPVPDVTPLILDILDRYEAPATFFMVGQNAERYPELVKEVIRRGHAVGNHTYHHAQGHRLSLDEYMTETATAARHIPSRLFRPPHGWLSRRQADALRNQGYQIVMYDVVTRDYSRRLSAHNVVQNVKRYARPGSIIVFHDSLKSLPRIIEALPAALKWLRDEGYSFTLLNDTTIS